MVRCTHKGCQADFDESNNPEGSCRYHPGGPVFHEGLKSWSCCNEVNKPVMEFEAFMAIPPCAQGRHTTEAPVNAAPASSSQQAAPTLVHEDGSETYGATPKPPSTPAASTITTATPPPPSPKETEEDDLSVPVPEGSRCKRLGCKAVWEGEAVSRGDGEKAKCVYHPQAPVFHEGSKGYLCCKRRVLEFDEFMKIEGCTTGKHLFVGAKKDESKEEIVTCRLDHYQTPTQVHVSAFAKGADKERSKVTFDAQSLHLDLYLPGNKRIVRSVTLYGPIDPSACTYRILSTKVDIVLAKPGAASWPLLELPAAGTELPPGYALTFGVTGRTGTVGGKEIVLAPEELAKRG
ncbi:HSP20-like chaperone [Papiliotrema laurentii]|uniref:HSP20-like chaperone n=1 Tax=Papiliotrema laurentii TaxID=5418 RepID=A0AAD9FWZ6_PAPLA|nr:HSP20-like chaperone [Papiliotrema laurentii]